MAQRVMDLKLHSASNLKDVTVFSRMEVYAVASVYGDPRTRQRTETDHDGGRHPRWNPDRTLCFVVPPTAAAAFGSGARLHVLLRTERLFSFGGRDVGEVDIPLAELLAGAFNFGGATAWQWASLPVKRVRGSEHRGTLSVSYRFGPVVAPFVPGIGYQLPKYHQEVNPPSFPRMLPGAGLLGGSLGGTRLGDMPSSDRSSAYAAAGHGTAAANAGAVAV